MAQYDVYVNPQPQSRPFVPFVVDVQSTLIDRLSSRLVLPLSRVGANMPIFPADLCPIVSVDGERLTVQPHMAAPVSANLLKKPVTNLQPWASEIAIALDAVISRV